MAAISFQDVSFSYPRTRVLKELTFNLEKGEKRSLIGKNGSGKTTALKILAGLLVPEKGTCSILDHDPDETAIKSKIGFLPEDASPYRLLSVMENVEYSAALRGVDDPKDKALKILDYFELRNFERVRASHLSRGNSQRLSISIALVHEPEVMILDEPLNYLDFPTQELAVKFIRKADSTVLVSTHILSTASRLTDRLMLLSNGGIAWSKTIQEIEEEESGESLEAKVARLMNA